MRAWPCGRVRIILGTLVAFRERFGTPAQLFLHLRERRVQVEQLVSPSPTRYELARARAHAHMTCTGALARARAHAHMTCTGAGASTCARTHADPCRSRHVHAHMHIHAHMQTHLHTLARTLVRTDTGAGASTCARTRANPAGSCCRTACQRSRSISGRTSGTECACQVRREQRAATAHEHVGLPSEGKAWMDRWPSRY